jgi:hypothetical protein
MAASSAVDHSEGTLSPDTSVHSRDQCRYRYISLDEVKPPTAKVVEYFKITDCIRTDAPRR